MLVFLFVREANAATITWDGGGVDELWSTANNWSGNYVPNATDTVVFSASSTKSVTIDQAVTIQGINIDSTYSTGTISQTTSFITLGSVGFTMASGTWIGGTAKINIATNGFFSLSGGYFSAPSSTGATSSIDIERNFTVSGGTYSASGATTTFTGQEGGDNSVITCTGVLSGNVLINKAGGLATTVVSGCTIDLGTNPTTMMAGSGSQQLINNGTINASGTWTVTELLTGAGGSSAYVINNGTINHSGTGWDFNDGGFIQNAGATTTFAGTSITVERNFTYNGTFDLSGKTLTLNGDDNVDDSILTCGVPMEGSLILNKSNAFGDLIIGGCTIGGNFTRTDGRVMATSTALTTLTVLGNLSTVTTDRFGETSSTLSFASSGIQYASSTGVPWGGPLNVSTTLGELRLSSNLLASSTCDVVQGILNLSGRNLTCGGALTVQDGGTLRLQGAETVTAPIFQATSTLLFTGDGDGASDSYTITSFATSVTHLVVSSTDSQDSFLISLPLDLDGNFSFATGTISVSTTVNVGGNWTNSSGVFNRGTSTVIFDGSGPSTITGTTTFDSLTSIVSNKSLIFGAGQTTGVSSTLTFTNVVLTSLLPNTQWLINPSGTRTISGVNVTDSFNSNATAIDCTSGCTDGGNNFNWTFGAVAITVTPTEDEWWWFY